jgi:hypothetical protein
MNTSIQKVNISLQEIAWKYINRNRLRLVRFAMMGNESRLVEDRPVAEVTRLV